MRFPVHPNRDKFPLWLVAVVGVLGLWGAAWGSPAAAERGPDLTKPLSQREPFVVGATSDSYPYAYVDDDGRWTGYTAEIFQAAARAMDLQYRLVIGRGQDNQARFKAGEFDMLQSLSQTPERDEYADFSVPFLTLQGALFVAAKDSPIHRLEDLNGRSFALIGGGSIGKKFLEDHGLKVQIRPVSSSVEALRLVDQGECAATFLSQLTALAVKERHDLKNVAVFERPLADYDIRHCFAVHKGDARLLARLNEGLLILQRSGELERIRQHWFGRFEPRILTYEQVATWGAIVFAVAFALTLAGFLHQRALRRRLARQRAELEEQTTLLRALYDNLPFVVAVLEGPPSEATVRSLNRQGEAHVGCPAGEAVGRPLADLPVDPEWRRHLQDLLRRLPEDPTGLLREERSLSSSRKRLVFVLLPLTPGPGGLRRTCVLIEDVTERRALDDEIAQSRKLRAIGELVGGIAHEFNNLLTPIIGASNLLKLDRPDDPLLHTELDLIAAAGKRGAELTRRLLAFGRKGEDRTELVRLATAVDGSFSLMRLTVDRRIQLRNTVSPDLPPLYLNATDLNQVIANLVLNARDTLMEKLGLQRDGWTPGITVEGTAEPPERRPELARRSPGGPLLGWQCLRVTDNGMGMSPEVRERIFEPFFTTKDVGQGTGLGLATVWHLVHAAGGHVEVESQPGQGTTFKVWLPVYAPPVAVDDVKMREHPANSRPLRVFVADDDDLVARTITAVLQRSGHTVHREADGLAAWNFLRGTHAHFELAILDVNMPGMDGIALAQRVRSELGFAGHILVVSGRLSSNDLGQITEAKVDAVLTKPFTPQELLDAIQRCGIGGASGNGSRSA